MPTLTRGGITAVESRGLVRIEGAFLDAFVRNVGSIVTDADNDLIQEYRDAEAAAAESTEADACRSRAEMLDAPEVSDETERLVGEADVVFRQFGLPSLLTLTITDARRLHEALSAVLAPQEQLVLIPAARRAA